MLAIKLPPGQILGQYSTKYSADQIVGSKKKREEYSLWNFAGVKPRLGAGFKECR